MRGRDPQVRIEVRKILQRPECARLPQGLQGCAVRFEDVEGLAPRLRLGDGSLGQLLGRPGLAAAIEADDMRSLGQRRQDALAFVGHGAHGVAALATQAGRHFEQLERQPVRQALLVIGKAAGHPGRSTFADGYEARFHGFRATATQWVALEVATGSVFGYLGTNGAGKTTTIRVLLGLVRPDTGHVRVMSTCR